MNGPSDVVYHAEEANPDRLTDWRLRELERKVRALEQKVWAILVLLIGNLMGIIYLIANRAGR